MINKIKQEQTKIRKEAKKQILGYITAALGLVAGLAWNEAIKALIEEFIPLGGSDLVAKLIYAFIVTIIIVIVSMYLVKALKKDED
ncbi:MAG: DUF5654 family protein [Patescibacteria group bacterium]